MGWKIFAVFLLVSLGLGLFGDDMARDAVDIVSIPVEMVTTFGVFVYAFGVERFDSRYWTAAAWVTSACGAVAAVVGMPRAIAAGSPVGALILAGVVVVAIIYNQWLALKRLGRGEHAFPPAAP